MTINVADAVYSGNTLADKVYAGGTLVWTATPPPEELPGCVLALDAVDAPLGSLVTWPDRSSQGNDLTVWSGTPISNGSFVTATTTNVLATSVGVPLIGNHSSHLLMMIRSRSVGGAFMGWGDTSGGALFDLWNYNPGALIWHGHGGSNDTVAGAPPFTPDVWHLVEVSYAATTGTMTVRVDELTPAQKTGLGLNTWPNPLLLGMGRYSPTGDFDLAELYLYDRVLSSTERAQVRTHLQELQTTKLYWLP